MKRNTFSLFSTLLVISVVSLASCGGAKGSENTDSSKNDSAATKVEAPKPKFEDVCTGSNALSLTIKGYKYSMKGNFVCEMANFEVKQSTWNLTSDSTATLKLMNYTSSELVGDRKENQIDIECELYGRNGKKIEPATFTTSSGKDYYVQTTMLTSKGKVWFNWLAGMPEVGTVKLNFVGSDNVCGTFALASEKPDNDMIGTVRLNGNFVVGK